MTIEAETQRAILTDNIRKFEAEQFALGMERKARQTMLAVADASKLRMGKYTGGDNKQATQAIRKRLAELEYEIEWREISIAEMQAALDALPPEEPEAEEPNGLQE